MADRYFEIQRRSNPMGNSIPSGRQLPRTPPLKEQDFCEKDAKGNFERDGGDSDQSGAHYPSHLETENISEPVDPNSVLKGMKGYQLTEADLEFIKKMKEEQLVKKLQGDLEEMQKLLKKETMAFELACASREKSQAELNKFPSCEELTEWLKVVLGITLPQTDFTDLDAKSLLAMVTMENVQRAVNEKKTELAEMNKTIKKKRKKEAKERGELEKQITNEQLKIQGLMRELSQLKSELEQEEAYKFTEMQTNTPEAPQIKEEPKDTKSQVKLGGKDRKKVVKIAEKSQNAPNKVKSPKSKRAKNKTESQANKNKSETTKTPKEEEPKRKSAEEKPTVKPAIGKQKRAEELNFQAQKRSRKTAENAQSTTSQPKSQVETGEETTNLGLRRSKRIASKR
ncbi:stress response protein NST1-like [Mugil cephalus]|uniref:stress response protein NST1-like n=1 Tax=Mugil cephalus TaxID=48193 RepID=UPI001FB84DAD|nr:stress response protein NST1-like [Mugil cephalus]